MLSHALPENAVTEPNLETFKVRAGDLPIWFRPPPPPPTSTFYLLREYFIFIFALNELLKNQKLTVNVLKMVNYMEKEEKYEESLHRCYRMVEFWKM